jgi:LmbE family N-acetylglucosaminyl deacetylase
VSQDPSLPQGLARYAASPEQLVVVWARSDVTGLLTAVAATGHLPLRVDPAETLDLVATAGAPALLMVDADLLDHAVVAVLDELRARTRSTRTVVLAGPDTRAEGLLLALRRGLSEVVDPSDPEAVAHLLATTRSTSSAGEHVLAVGAHPDDVEIGCGATLLRHREKGDPVTILTLSQGAVGGMREQRRQEAASVAMSLSAELLMADLPDTRLADAHEMIGLIEGVVAAVAPTTVYVHSKADNHQDHRAVHDATVIAARRVPQLFCFQSPSSRNEFAPTRFVPVDDFVQGKVELLARYASQTTRHYLEPDLVVATARYWARQLPHARYAEPFEVLRASEHRDAHGR